MFLCLVRLSPAAPCQGWNSLHAQVKSARLGDISRSLRNSHTVECPRYVCGYGCDAEPALSPRKRERDVSTDRNCWDSSRFTVPHREHFSRVTDLSRIQHKRINDGIHCNSLAVSGLHENGCRKLDRPPVESFLFTSGKQLSAPRFCTSAVQMRVLSTAATPKHKTGAGEEAADYDKGQEQGPTQASSPKTPEPEPDQGKPSKAQQLKKVFKEYGAVGVSFHVCISLISLGMFYAAVSSGIDMAGLLCKLGFSESVVKSKMAAGTSTFVLAYAVHKLFAPVRMSITLVSVPLIVRYFRKTGLFKAPASGP